MSSFNFNITYSIGLDKLKRKTIYLYLVAKKTYFKHSTEDLLKIS